MLNKIAKTVSGTMVGFALCFSSTVSFAATAPSAVAAPMSISPFVALSAYGTMQSRSAVCGAAVGVAGVAAAGQPAPGCVLPVVDPAAPVVVETAPVVEPVAYAPAATGGFGLGLGALLAGLVLVAGLAAVLLSDHNDGRLPISPD